MSGVYGRKQQKVDVWGDLGPFPPPFGGSGFCPDTGHICLVSNMLGVESAEAEASAALNKVTLLSHSPRWP